MALQLGAARAAFLAAGVPEDKAAASEELANDRTRLSGLRGDMRQGFAAADRKVAKMRGDINLLRWMRGTNSALPAAVRFRLLTH